MTDLSYLGTLWLRESYVCWYGHRSVFIITHDWSWSSEKTTRLRDLRLVPFLNDSHFNHLRSLFCLSILPTKPAIHRHDMYCLITFLIKLTMDRPGGRMPLNSTQSHSPPSGCMELWGPPKYWIKISLTKFIAYNFLWCACILLAITWISIMFCVCRYLTRWQTGTRYL